MAAYKLGIIGTPTQLLLLLLLILNYISLDLVKDPVLHETWNESVGFRERYRLFQGSQYVFKHFECGWGRTSVSVSHVLPGSGQGFEG